MSCDPRQWLDAAILQTGFLRRYPNFAVVLSELEVIAAEHAPVMAVSVHGGRTRLHVNTEAFDGELLGFRGVLQHELHHIVLGHVTDPTLQELERKDLLQIASEISANEYITEPLPGEPYLLRDFERYGLRAGQSTLERYELLVRASEDGRFEPRKLKVRCCQGDELCEDDIAELFDVDDVSELARHMRRAKLAKAARRQSVATSDGEPAIDWANELRRFALGRHERHLTLHRASRLDPKRRRLGELPGRVRRTRCPKLIVAIDTSGSMDAELFPQIDAELREIARGADLVVVECDDEIRREYVYDDALQEVHGRGSTDLRPVFAPECIARHRPDGVIYFTDGDGPYPDHAPDVRTLWVLTGGEDFDCDFGTQVRM